MAAAPAAAQGVPGKNVSIVGPTPQPAACLTAPFCDGLLPDHGLKQQNEPSCAISPETGNILCGGNDYRGSSRLDGVLGDAFMGVYMSRDQGLTWVSRMAPAFKGASSSLNLGYGADPVVMAFPGGMLYVFIAGNRGENQPGGVFSQIYIEVGKEDGYPFVPASGLPATIATGTSGRFLDKPGGMLNMLPSGTCDIPYQKSDGTAAVRTVPAFEASVAYAVFLGSDQSDGTAVYVSKTTDCGVNWTHPGKKVTQTLNINQGVTMTSIGNKYLAVWRTFSDSNQTSAINYSVSNNKGQSWSQAGVLASIRPFDQGTSSVTFRTTALPWLVSDGTAFHVFWGERRSATDPTSRIMVKSSTNGTSWSAAAFVDNASLGHQFMPSAASANGVTQVAWYDTKDDHTQVFTEFINDFRDETGVIRRHTADIRGAQGTWNGTSLVFSPSVKVSSYRTGLAPAGFLGPGSPAQVMKLEDNFLNSRIFSTGTKPFIGDYVAVAVKSLTNNNGTWVPNTAPSGQTPSFFVAWTDNRMLRGNTVADLIEPTGYTPPTLQGEPDPGQPPVPCVPGLENTRNQEIFGTMIRPGLIVSVPSVSKPTSTIQRAFVVQVVNNTSQPKSYKIHIANQPPDAPPTGTGRASFIQNPPAPELTPADTDQCVAVPRRSGAAITVFVTSSSPAPSIRVEVNEADASCQTVSGASASVTLNRNPQAPDMENPDFENPDFENFNLNLTEIHNPDFENRTFSFLTFANPDMENPDFENFTLAFPDMENPDFENPDFENVVIRYSNIKNPDMENPDFENAVLAAGGATELTWSMTMKGNTTSAIDARALFSTLPQTLTQLVVRRVYATNVSQSCSLVQVGTNQVVVNTVSQAGQMPTGTFYAAPGEVVLVTIRMVGEVNPNTIGINGTAQSINTDGSSAPFDEDLPAADVTPPVLTLPGPTTVEATSSSGATVTYAASATDNTAGPVPVACGPASGSLFPFGPTTVNCTADDGLGNVANGSFVVTVVDTTLPVLSDVPASFSVPATGPLGAIATYASPTATDLIDGTIGVTCAPASGSLFAIGPTTVTCTATDSHTNTATANFTVTVADEAAPVLTLPGPTTVEATSSTGATVTYAASANDDSAGSIPVLCNPASGSIFPFGPTTVNCSADDGFGNVANGSFVVTVVDTTLPVLSGVPASFTAPATGPSGAVVTYASPTATDSADGALSVICAPASGSTFAIGETSVTCTATDSHANTATANFTVTVADDAAPIVDPHANVLVEATSGSGADVTYTSPAVTDNVGVVSFGCAPASGATFPLGATTVTCTATDAANNTGTGTFTVTVVDTTSPVLSGVPASFGVPATGPSGAIGTYASPTAMDLVDGSVGVNCTPPSGSTFAIAVTTVTCTTTDSHSNTATASFTVTVADTAAPVVGPHANVSQEATSGLGAAVLYSNPTATDNVGVVSFGCAPASGTVFPLGPTTVTCTARDAANNTGTGSFTVTVVDTTPPVIAPHAPVIATASTTSGGIATYTNPTATDLVDGSVPVSCLPASGGAFPLGPTTVNCTATDLHSNQATSNFTVTVQFGFIGLLTPWRPPPPVYTVNLGSAVSVKWKYTNAAGALLDTSALQPIVTFTLLQSCGGATETSTVYTDQAFPGNSNFNYSGEGWKFNWLTVPPVTAGCYNIRTILPATGQVNGPFPIRLR